LNQGLYSFQGFAQQSFKLSCKVFTNKAACLSCSKLASLGDLTQVACALCDALITYLCKIDFSQEHIFNLGTSWSAACKGYRRARLIAKVLDDTSVSVL